LQDNNDRIIMEGANMELEIKNEKFWILENKENEGNIERYA
jgi:hypothetical protein